MWDRIENIDFVLKYLFKERGETPQLPDNLETKQRLMRALMNVRQPVPASDEFIAAQDAELKLQAKDKGIVKIDQPGISIWQGDITRLQMDAIVNAANSQLLGCWQPLHACIDNCIHSAAGIQLRQECHELMQAQGHEEPTGLAKITKGYNLPAKYVIHTVGPIILDGHPTPLQEELLASCYRSCLEVAELHKLQSIAFCCISTGVFHFPNQRAAEIAVETVKKYPLTSLKTIVFNVFIDKDYDIYHRLIQ